MILKMPDAVGRSPGLPHRVVIGNETCERYVSHFAYPMQCDPPAIILGYHRGNADSDEKQCELRMIVKGQPMERGRPAPALYSQR